MNIELESMAIEMPRVAGHPNREPFRGVLTLVDAASDKPPAGARGHRVLLSPLTAMTPGEKSALSHGQRLWGGTSSWVAIYSPKIFPR